MHPVQLDLPGTPFNKARKARDFILAAIKERVAERKLDFERGSVKKDTLLAFYASAKVDEGDPLDEHELAVRLCAVMLSRFSVFGNMQELSGTHLADCASEGGLPAESRIKMTAEQGS